MRIILLTRTSRPSGALIAKNLIDNNKELVAIVAEERQELLKRKGGVFSIIFDSFKHQGLGFTAGRILEAINIKLHFILRKLLTSRFYHSRNYLSIEELALEHRIPYFVVKDHNSKETEKIIRDFSPDLIVVSNTRLLRKNIFNIPKFAAINLHTSLLPKYAGLDSIFWALFYGEKEIGVTVHFVNEELDRGDIVLQKKIPVERSDNEAVLISKARKLGAQLMIDAITQIEENKVSPIRQDRRQASYFKWPTKEERQLLKKKLKRRRKIKEDSPVKALHVITRLVKGGAQENTLLTVLGLKEKGYDVMLVSGPSFGPEGEIESAAREMGVNLVIIPELVREISPVKDIISFAKIYSLIKKYRFDIVHTHTSKAGIVGRLAAKFAGATVIVHTPHGHVFHSYFGRIKTGLFKILEMISANFCDRIITLTDFCKEEHIKQRIAPEEKFITIHSGISLEKFLNRSYDIAGIKKELAIAEGAKVIGSVARLEPVKGIEFFVESVSLVLKAMPQTHFIIVGDGSQRKLLEEKAKKLGVDRKVTFSGLQEDVPKFISIMDVMVLPSLNEGMGRALVEAGLMGKPVVATRVSGIPELVKDGVTGILIEPADSQGLAKGIIQLLTYPEKAKVMGENARIMMKDNFSAEKMIEEIDKLYRELLRRN